MRSNRFLQLLKTRGPLTAKEIAEELGITGEGARLQLVKLSEEGLVSSLTLPKGVGRPVQVYEITDLGNAHFPNKHAELTVQLLNTVKQQLGEDALETIIHSREKEAIKKYSAILKNASSLEKLIEGYTAIRSSEGYMAEFKRESESEYILFENHCPIGAAATSCQGFCESDLRILREIMGDKVAITRINHIASGERRCTYRIAEIKEDKEQDVRKLSASSR